MDPKDLNATLDLLKEALSPQEFVEFIGELKKEIRRQLQEEMGPDLEATKKRILGSYVKLVKHVQSTLAHFGETLDSEGITPAPTPAPEPPPPTPPPPPPSNPFPPPSSSSSPIEIPPAIKEVLRPSSPASKPFTPAKPSPAKRFNRSTPVPSSPEDRKMVAEGVYNCLRSTRSATGIRFEDILLYLEKFTHFPVNTDYWQYRDKDNRSRFESHVRYRLTQLEKAGKIRQEKKSGLWFLA
jgi:hypothetical protein